MDVFNLRDQQEFNVKQHVEKILVDFDDGDVTVACWEPDQVSPNHCHPKATEIYFCFEGGGTMRTPDRIVDVVPGAFVLHPPGEVHEYINGSRRTLLFRVRCGTDMIARVKEWSSNSDWSPTEEDQAYFREKSK